MKRYKFVCGLLFMTAFSLLLWDCSQQSKVPHGDGKVILHRMEEGETLEQIAEDYYGDPKRSESLRKFNNLSDGIPAPGAFIHVPLSKVEMQKLKRREDARIPYNKGLELASRGAYVDAAQKFQSALDLDPSFVDARYNLGVTYQNMKAYDKAFIQYEEVARLRQRNPAYAFAAGYCLYHMEQHNKAVKWFKKVLSIDPEHSRAQFALAAAFEKMGKGKQAKKAWRRYLEIDSASEWAVEARKRLENLGP